MAGGTIGNGRDYIVMYRRSLAEQHREWARYSYLAMAQAVVERLIREGYLAQIVIQQAA